MKTTEDLFYGNIIPVERNFAKNSAYHNAAREQQSAKDKLRVRLNAEEQKLFENYISKSSVANMELEKSAFTCGFQLACKLLIEALYEPEAE